MQQPWGLSGPQFLGVYSAAFVATVLLVVGIRYGAGLLAKGRLTTYQAAFLIGGTERVLIAGVFELLANVHVHRSRDGRLTSGRGFTARDPLQAAIARNMAVSAKWSDRVAKLKASPAIEDLQSELRESGLLLTPAGSVWWSAALLLPIVVWVTGLVRLINGANAHRPVGDLIVLLLGSAIVVIALLGRIKRRGVWSTPRGAALVGRLRSRHQYSSEGQGGRQMQLTGIALLGIVAAGTAVQSLAGSAVGSGAGLGTPGGNWLGLGGGGGYSGGGSCGGGGGGCGGGGCGGGCGG
ncbi:MAG TPA: TIGR04222 domain-containing membrane protein [Pseudonocardiaceae bacterium]|nr:TIGR04222 domain-containing membrane protein [Pseudonocardiaceae bacterium]